MASLAKKLGLAIVISITLLAVFLLTGGSTEVSAPRYGGVLRVRAISPKFDPVFDPVSSSHVFVVEQLYDNLVRFDNNFNIVPGLAEYWKISDDGLRIVFYLRRGVKFHNGRELTASDVKFSLERLMKISSRNRIYPYFVGKVVGSDEFVSGNASEVSGFREVDEYTFEIQWTRPYVSSLYLLAMSYCKILPKDQVSSQGGRFFQKPVGTGPFKFLNWLRNSRLDILGVRLERNVSYYGNKPYVDGIDYSPFFTDDQFEEGLVHMIPVVSEKMLNGKYTILENNSLRVVYLALGCTLPPIDNKAVRQALSLGIDKISLARACSSPRSEFQPIGSFIPSILPGFFPVDRPPAYEPEKARTILRQELQLLPDQKLNLALVLTLPRNEWHTYLSRELSRQLDLLGINLETRYLKSDNDILNYKMPYLKLLDYTLDFPDPEDIILPIFYSKSELNRINSHYSSARLDELLAQAEVEASWEKRLSVFKNIEKILLEEAPAIPLFSEKIRIAVQPRVKGVKPPALGFSYMDTKKIWIEK